MINCIWLIGAPPAQCSSNASLLLSSLPAFWIYAVSSQAGTVLVRSTAQGHTDWAWLAGWQVEEFLQVAMCCPVLQGYGLTESCAASFIGLPGRLVCPVQSHASMLSFPYSSLSSQLLHFCTCFPWSERNSARTRPACNDSIVQTAALPHVHCTMLEICKLQLCHCTACRMI